MNFEILGDISDIETIATGNRIREITRLRRAYGSARWRTLKGIATIRLANGRRRLRFAICMENTGYPGSLELHKVYQVLADPDAERDGDIRVIDESGEDYLYPAHYFILVEMPKAVEQALLRHR